MDRNALARATEATSSPTPGYLYIDIAKSSATSPQTSTDIAKYLTRRLSQKSNPNIKYKCLKIVTKTSTNPINRGMFKRAVAQDHEAVACIKACLNFRGPPDAARGDEPYEKVRAAAKECLDAVYSDSPSSGEVGGAGGMGGMGSMSGIAGGGVGGSYGHPVAGGAGGGGGGGGGSGGMGPPGSAPPGAHPHATRRMEGIGNPQFRDPRLDGGGAGAGGAGETVKSMVATAAEGFKGIIADPLARNAVGAGGQQPGIGGGGSYGGPSGGGGGAYGGPPGRSELSAATNGQWTMASNRGPNAVGAAPQYAHAPSVSTGVAAANRGVGGSWGAGGTAPTSSGMSVAAMSRAEAHGGLSAVGAPPPPPTAPPPPPSSGPAMGTGTAGRSASDGSYERTLIMELCPPGGMKAEPPPDKLAQFVRAFPSLDCDLVCPVLLDCLEDGQPWIIKAKALCVIEKIVIAADEQGNDAYSSFFHACAEEIEPLAVHSRAAIHNPARRVLKALGMDAAYSAGSAQPPARKPAAVAVQPVPNLLDFDEPAAATAAAAVPDMLGGDAPPTAAAPPAAAPPAPAAGGDMFGGLTTKSKAEAPAAAAPAPPAPAATPAPAQGADLFGDMKVKASASAEGPKENGAAAPAAGSAFGFMNASANGGAPAVVADPAPAPAAAAPPAAAPSPGSEAKKDEASFDPLLSLSAPSEPSAADKVAKTQAQIAQMQAMQYQQQMMMMQQQMAQMQMAMGGGGGVAAAAQRPATHQAAGASAGVNPNVMSSHGGGTSAGFSFLDTAPGAAKQAKEKKDAAFNFVMDDMKKG